MLLLMGRYVGGIFMLIWNYKLENLMKEFFFIIE